MEERYYIWGVFYFDKKDKRVIVPKLNNWMGWTVNFARPQTYLIILILVVVAIISSKL